MKEKYNIKTQEIILNENQNKEDTIKVIFAGDFAPINRVEESCKNNSKVKIVFDSLKEEILDKDLFIVNLEAPLTSSDEFIEKIGPIIKADPSCIDLLQEFKVDIACLANNHIKDFKERGVIETIDLCKSKNIYTVGAGKNIFEAATPLIINKKDIRLGILNFAENEFSIANQNEAGANPIDPYNNYYQIKNLKEKVDYVIVIIHGGVEHYSYPTPRLKKIFHYFADIGANLIVGHHTHCVSGFEIYKNVPMFYSLGNFLFDWPGETFSKWFEGFLLKINISKNSIEKVKIIPYEQCRNQLSIEALENSKKQEFFKAFMELSNMIENDKIVNNKWQDLITQRRIDYLSSLLDLNKLSRYLLKKGKFKIKKERLLKLLNIIRCETHNELSISILKKEIERG